MNSKALMSIAAIVIAVIVIASGGFYLYQNSQSSNEAAMTTSEVTSVPEEEVDENAEKSIDEVSEATIILSEDDFSPKTITIKVGDSVVWLNESGRNATVDSNPHPIHTSYPDMNLGTFSDGEELEFTFSEPGTYEYHNHANASQGGTVIVE